MSGKNLEKLKKIILNKKMDSYYRSPTRDEPTDLIFQIPKEEAYYKFKEKLKSLGITVTWKWEDACRLLFNCLKWKDIRLLVKKKFI